MAKKKESLEFYKAYEITVPHNIEILELINRRERQLLVHSCIYYRLGNNLISDHTFDDWCKELVKLIADNPHEFSLSQYAEDFKGFDGSSGFDLPYNDPRIVGMASFLIESKKRNQSELKGGN
jgi:NAD-dependent DNA ligase (contains BRCT domain type II)